MRSELRFLSPEDFAALAGDVPDRYRALILVAGYGGVRFGASRLTTRSTNARDAKLAVHLIRDAGISNVQLAPRVWEQPWLRLHGRPPPGWPLRL
jgi:hypothetical protein